MRECHGQGDIRRLRTNNIQIPVEGVPSLTNVCKHWDNHVSTHIST